MPSRSEPTLYTTANVAKMALLVKSSSDERTNAELEYQTNLEFESVANYAGVAQIARTTGLTLDQWRQFKAEYDEA